MLIIAGSKKARFHLTAGLVTINFILIVNFWKRIIIGLDRQFETKQGIEGKSVRFRLGRVRDKDRRSEPDCQSEAINFGAC